MAWSFTEMILLYPNDPFQPKRPDEAYAEEYEAAVSSGLRVSLFSYEEFLAGIFKPLPRFESDEVVCYRGWMLSSADYERLCDGIRKGNAVPFTEPVMYELCHYLPSWYPQLSDYTPETHFFTESDDLTCALREFGWTGCFLKDYVKSLSTDEGSLVTDLDRIPQVIAKMKKFRGLIEGGLCARMIEDFVPESETRHFVVRGIPHTHEGHLPEIVSIAAARIASPFFSVDTIMRKDGQLRIVELGDGQVSDRKAWPAQKFVEMLR